MYQMRDVDDEPTIDEYMDMLYSTPIADECPICGKECRGIHQYTCDDERGGLVETWGFSCDCTNEWEITLPHYP